MSQTETQANNGRVLSFKQQTVVESNKVILSSHTKYIFDQIFIVILFLHAS